MERQFKGIWIPKEIWLNKDLSIIDKHLLAEIDSLDNDDGCYAKNQYFADFLGITPTRVSQIISKLKKLGYIKETFFDGRKRILKVIFLKKENSDKLPVETIVEKEIQYPQAQDIVVAEEQEKEKEKELIKQEIIKWWNDTIYLNFALCEIRKIDGNREKQLLRRLKECGSILEFKQIIYNALNKSKFLRGENKNGWRATFDFCLKESNFQKLIEGNFDDKKQETDINSKIIERLKLF